MVTATSPYSILVVEDNQDLVIGLQDMLRHDGYAVSVAGTVAGAIELVRSHRFNAILLDLGLPPSPGTPTEGLATLAELLVADSLAKIVIITGDGGESYEALYAVHRFEEEGWEAVVGAGMGHVHRAAWLRARSPPGIPRCFPVTAMARVEDHDRPVRHAPRADDARHFYHRQHRAKHQVARRNIRVIGKYDHRPRRLL